MSVVDAALDSGGAPLPRRFGRYMLVDQIGEGGMARIYLAREVTDLGGERMMVVKLILPMLAQSREFSQLLVDEAKLSATLSHGNIVQVTDLGRESDDELYIAMEYVEGFDLRDLLRKCSTRRIALPMEFALLIVMETLKSLDYAHRRRNDDTGEALGIVHCDVSPSNVLLSFEGEVKLCDFGIARAFGSDFDLPESAIQGKAGYMSPEAAANAGVDSRSDVFAVGIMLWELIAGQRFHKGEGGRAPTLEQAAHPTVLPLPERGLVNEARLQDIAYRALQIEPEARYQYAADMLRDLQEYVAASGFVASSLRFGDWLVDNFGAEILEQRRARERAATAHEHAEYAGYAEHPSPALDQIPAPPAVPRATYGITPPPDPMITELTAQRSSSNRMTLIIVLLLMGAAAALGVTFSVL